MEFEPAKFIGAVQSLGVGDGPLLVSGGLQDCSLLQMFLWQLPGAERRWLRKGPWRVDILGNVLRWP